VTVSNLLDVLSLVFSDIKQMHVPLVQHEVWNKNVLFAKGIFL